MPRKCTVCQHPERKEIDRRIIEGQGSGPAIARLFNLSHDAIARHRRHIDNAIRSAQLVKSTGFRELLQAVERLIAKLQKHLTNPRKSEIWFQESRELRNWIALRARLAGKLVADDGEDRKRAGDVFNIQFIAPDCKPVKIPLSVYGALPASVFNAAKAENSDAVLQETHKISDEQGVSDRGNGSSAPTSMQLSTELLNGEDSNGA